MIIKQLDIKSFGKLKEVNIELNPGLNVIYGSNEAGKSTMQHFIKAMLYGMNSQKKNIRDNDRRRFMPWEGSRAEGRLIFEDDNGKEYVIERSFANQKREDQSAVFNWTTGEKAVHMDSNSPGRDILGLGEEAFEKTLFIKQLGAVVERDKEDEIMKKLINLHQSGEEDTSYHNAQSILEDYKKSIKGIRKNGRLDEVQEKISALNTERAELQKLQNENIDDSIALRNINQSISRVTSELAKLKEDKGNLVNWSSNNEDDQAFEGEEVLKELREHLFELKNNALEAGIKETEPLVKGIEAQLDVLEGKVEELKNFDLRGETISRDISDLDSRLNGYAGFNQLEEDIGHKASNIVNEIKDKEEKLKVIQELKEMQFKLNSSEVKDNVRAKMNTLKDKKNNSSFIVAAGGLLCITGVWGILSMTVPFIMLGIIGIMVLAFGIFQLRNISIRQQELYKLADEDNKVEQLDREYEENKLKEDLGRLNRYMDFLYKLCSCSNTGELLEKLDSYKELKDRKKMLEIELAALQGEMQRYRERLGEQKRELEKDMLAFETDNEISSLNSVLLELEKKKKDIEHSILIRFSHKRELFVVEAELQQCLTERDNLEELYDCSNIAEEVLKEAFEEIQQNFAPRLNKEVGHILSEITGQKYNEVRISSDYGVSVMEGNRSREIDYFSSGTFDQIYLALRLGLCNIIFENRRVPVILDDTFVQYDEDRLAKVMEFLKDYAKEHQVIIFTCRKLSNDRSISIDI